ncbi:MAG: hypothetical protein WCG55_01410 [bacterium]
MENFGFPQPKRVEMFAIEDEADINQFKNKSAALQDQIDSYLESLKGLIAQRDEYQRLLEENPNDTFVQGELNVLQVNIDSIHDQMNELSAKKMQENFNVESYNEVSKAIMTHVPKESLN